MIPPDRAVLDSEQFIASLEFVRSGPIMERTKVITELCAHDAALRAENAALRNAIALALPALERCAKHLQGRPEFREDENILSYRSGELRAALGRPT